MNRKPHFSLLMDQKIIDSFKANKSSHQYLAPLGLSLKSPIPKYFSTDRSRLSEKQERQMFEAIRYLQYWIVRMTNASKQLRVIKMRNAIRNRIVCANLGLIHRAIHATSVYSDSDTLLSAGHMALIEATENFDPYRGIKFSTYATVSILRRFAKEIKRKQLPIHDDADPADVVDEWETPDEKDERNFMVEKLHKMMDVNAGILKKDDIDILTLRYNLGHRNSRRWTLQEVAEKHNLSKERIRQLQQEALDKLQMAFKETVCENVP